jgi:AcrR family transcriptional regulator
MSTEETRQRLLVQGRLAFAERGHDGVSLQRDVLKPSGVSNGSFYHQFSDKTELLVAILDEAATNARLVMEAAADEQPASAEPSPAAIAERVARGFRLWFDLVDGAEDLFRIQLRERNHPDERIRGLVADIRNRWLDRMAELLAPYATPGAAPDDIRQAARLIGALTTGVVIDYIDTPRPQRDASREALIDAMTRFAVGGLAALDAT